MDERRDDQKNVDRHKARTWLIVVLLILVILAWLTNFFLVPWHFPRDERGTFRDMFGAVNALFSDMAFAGVAYAIYIQRIEIGIAKDDLRVTHKIMREQGIHIERQNAQSQKAGFELAFFNLVDLLISITSSIPDGHLAFANFVNDLKPKFKSHIVDDLDPNFNDFYRVFWLDREINFDNYFGTLVTFLDEVNIDHNDKIKYARFVRALLSGNEVRLLAVYCATSGGRKLRDAVEKYALLEYMPDEDMWQVWAGSEYPPSAFGKEVPGTSNQPT